MLIFTLNEIENCVVNDHDRTNMQGRYEGGRGHNYPGAESLRGAPKSPNNVISTFFNTVHLLPKDLRFEHGSTKLASCPGRHLTSLRPC